MTPLLLGVACLAGLITAARWARRHLVVVDVAGESMEPTLRSGDVLLARRVSPERITPGQIVVARRHYAGALGFDVKRVAGVTAHGLYLLGDNHHSSKDSRSVGLYNRDTVLGVVITRLRRARATPVR